MTLKNEIFEGIAAYKGLTPTSQDDYYNYRLQQLKKQQKKDDEVEAEGKAEVDRQNARRMGVTGPVAPTVASSAVPGSPQTAMATGWDPSQPAGPDNIPVARQGGMIRKFADGGSAGGSGSPDPDLPDPGDAPPVDNLIRELLQRGSDQAAERISRDVGEPWTVLAPNSEWAGEGATQRAADLEKTRGAQARDEQAFQTSAPTVQPTTRAGRVLTAINDVVSPPGSRGETTRRERDLADVRTARDKIPGLFNRRRERIAQSRQAAPRADDREPPPSEPPVPSAPGFEGIEPRSMRRSTARRWVRRRWRRAGRWCVRQDKTHRRRPRNRCRSVRVLVRHRDRRWPPLRCHGRPSRRRRRCRPARRGPSRHRSLRWVSQRKRCNVRPERRLQHKRRPRHRPLRTVRHRHRHRLRRARPRPTHRAPHPSRRRAALAIRRA